MNELKTGGGQGYLRIATEEAFITAEVLAAYKRLIADGFDDPDDFLPLGPIQRDREPTQAA